MPIWTDPGQRVVVRVAAAAFFDMIYATAESAVVPPEMTDESLRRLTAWDISRKRRKVFNSPLPPSLVFSKSSLEVAGIVAGREEVEADRIVFAVDRVFPVSMWRTDESVGHDCRSPELLDEFAAALDLPFEVIGGFHSHPLVDLEIAEIEREQRFLPSPGDLHRPPFFWGHTIDLIVSVTKAGTGTPTPPPSPGPLAQFRVAEFEFWMVAHTKWCNAVALEIESGWNATQPQSRTWQRSPPRSF